MQRAVQAQQAPEVYGTAAEAFAAIQATERRHLQARVGYPRRSRLVLLRLRAPGGSHLPIKSVIAFMVFLLLDIENYRFLFLNNLLLYQVMSINIFRCPVHSKPFRLPYEEMRPENPRRKFFTCDRGISSDDVVLPPRREACTCSTSAFPEKPSFPPSPETCALQEAIGTNVETLTTENDPICRKMSRCEMLQLLMTTKNNEMNLLVIARKTVTGCESRCKCDSLAPLQKGP